MGKNSWKADYMVWLAPPAILILCCGLSVVLPPLYNNWQLAQFSNNLFTYPLPPQTEIISRSAEVGLMGNGNHCDFVAEQVMITQLSREAIEGYYAEVALPPVNNHNEGKVPEARGQPLPISLSFDEAPLQDGARRFTISLIDLGYSAGLDFRCN